MAETVEIEVRRRKSAHKSSNEISDLVQKFICSLSVDIDQGTELLPLSDLLEGTELSSLIESIVFCNPVKPPVKCDDIRCYVYVCNSYEPEIETLENLDEPEEIPASKHWILPSCEFIGLWESLIYESDVKENLFKFIQTTVNFSKCNINDNIINYNRLALLHGPPGTGKTSLCKALAQKISIRMSNVYAYAHLVEINSHSLFSKWFSESGKLVLKLFNKIREILENRRSLVCVLIDEVESIAYARSSISTNEPTDSLRVVNSVLTQLDQIKRYPNVIILTTSNLTSNIDPAFLDRADIKQYIGTPAANAIYTIYLSAVKELIKNGIIYGDVLNVSQELIKISEISVGLSGRSLRKLPFLAFALFANKDTLCLEEFYIALQRAIERNWSDIKALNHVNR